MRPNYDTEKQAPFSNDLCWTLVGKNFLKIVSFGRRGGRNGAGQFSRSVSLGDASAVKAGAGGEFCDSRVTVSAYEPVKQVDQADLLTPSPKLCR